jgi:gluconolactonase
MKGGRVAIDVKSEKLYDLVGRDAQVERLATGFTFTEGPLWNKEGGFLLFSDMPGDVRRRWDERNGVQEVARPSNKGNGMTYDAEGRLVVCEHSTSSVVRIDPDGAGSGRELIASHYQGKELNSPNDVVVKADGSIYFSDPTYGRMPGFGVEREQELAFQGVYRVPPGGGEPHLLIDDFDQPNGLCFSPDESLLYINDTTRAHIRVFDVAAGGTIANGRRPRRRLGFQPGGRAPGRCRDPRERRQHPLGWAGVELDVRLRLHWPLPLRDQGGRPARAFHELRRSE